MEIKRSTKRGVLFQKCRKCGRLFDLNYELDDSIAELMQVRALAFEQLCWDCRGR